MTKRRTSGWLTALLMVSVLCGSGCATRATQVGTGQEGPKGTGEGKTEQVVEVPVKEVPLDVAKAVPELPPPSAEPETPYLLDVLFDFDQSALRIDAVSAVETNARNLSKDSKVSQILLEGRGDEVGTSAYNIVLAERRARAVKRYLETLGMTASSINVVSYGKDRPLCLEHNPECWQKNRSVRFTVK